MFPKDETCSLPNLFWKASPSLHHSNHDGFIPQLLPSSSWVLSSALLPWSAKVSVFRRLKTGV